MGFGSIPITRFFYCSPTNVGVRKKAWAHTASVGTTRRTMLSFFKAFSGRFSKYLFRKTLLHAQKVNSQLKAPRRIHTDKNIERFIKRLTTAIQKMWLAVYCLSEASLQRANLITSL